MSFRFHGTSLWKCLSLLLSFAFTAMATHANAALVNDRDGFVTPGDATCWLNPACSIPRGGDSDVMTVYAPDGSIFAQAFAFGAEEESVNRTANVYYFDPRVIPVDPSLFTLPSGLIEPPDPSGVTPLSDIFGIAQTPLGLALAFSSDPPWDQDYWPYLPNFPVCLAANGCSLECPQPPLTPGFGVVECPDILNPVPEPGSADSRYLTIAYDATPYLSPELRAQGFRADFRSDTVPEPATLALVGLGLAGLAGTRRRKQ